MVLCKRKGQDYVYYYLNYKSDVYHTTASFVHTKKQNECSKRETKIIKYYNASDGGNKHPLSLLPLQIFIQR